MFTQLSFSDLLKVNNSPRFGGTTFSEERDGKRLAKQLQTVFQVMQDGEWRTPKELETITNCSWASLSARLRDLRKPKWGKHTVERKWLGSGLFSYRLLVNPAHPELS